MHAMRAIGRFLANLLANLLRGAVRCMFPLASLAVLAALIYSDQGRDVLVGLVEFAAKPEHGNSFSGLLFLAAGTTALSVSVWYSMRWLLGLELPGLPLPDPPGWGLRWAPRIAGGVPPAVVAINLLARDAGHRSDEWIWAIVFAALAGALVTLYAWRGDLLVVLQKRGWIAAIEGRDGVNPARLRAHEATPALTLRVVVWTIALTLVIGLMMVLFRVTLPRVVGAAAVAAMALASINLFGSFALTYWPLRHGLPPLAVVALLVAAALGPLNDNHRVTRADAAPEPQPRLQLTQDFERFLAGAKRTGSDPPPVLFVASEGGGIRAAYWTAAVLEQLAQKEPDLLRHNLYALSGVSGGSLGVAAWLMSRRTQYCPQAAGEAAAARSAGSRAATESLGMDFVAPAVAGLFYYDFAQRFLPFPVPTLDRSRAMEQGWQHAFAHLPGRPFERTLDQLYSGCPELPRLLLNATVVETGQRAVLGPLVHGDEQACLVDGLFLNAMPAMAADLDTRKQPLAGLVHHSARFPLISPAGTVQRPVRTAGASCPTTFRLVDGGYFDNSGALTVIDLVRRLRESPPNASRDFRAIVLVVRNEASALCSQTLEPPSPFDHIAPEITSVVGALARARGSHAVAARAALWHNGIEVVDLVVPKESDAANAPLGWALSDRVREQLNDAAATRVEQVLPLLAQRVDPCGAQKK